MNVRPITILLAAAAFLAAAPALSGCSDDQAVKSVPAVAVSSAPDATGATYLVEGKSVSLVHGRAESPAAPDSAAKVVTQLGQTATGDVDGDGKPDTAVILTSSGGGSGTFSYVGLVRSGSAGPVKAVLLGDRVSVTSIAVDGGAISVAFLDRPAGAPMAATPSVAVTRRFVLAAGELTAK